MASIFEKTMAACLESRKPSASKRIVEKSSVKKATKKKVTESTLREEDEMDVDVDVDTDPVEDELTMGDVEDDIVVVVDPSIDEDEFSQVASDAQDIVDSTPDDEIPMTDEYVGDYTYTCPICGNTFFSDVEMNDGDECPVCGDFPNGYVLVGEIAPADDSEDNDDFSDEISDDEDLDIDVDVTDDNDEELDLDVDSAEECSVKHAKKDDKYYQYDLDESTFNSFFTKFVKENYRNAKSLTVSEAVIKGSTLSLECALTFKSNKIKPVTLTIERFKPARSMTLGIKESTNVFKVESKSKKSVPFVINAVIENKKIKCTGLKYNFITKVSENKKAQVYGKLMRESRNYYKKK